MGCLKRGDCRYCHMCPEGELKRRKKAKVAMIRMGVVEPGVRSMTEELEEVVAIQDPVEYKMTIKNTFIHMELSRCEEAQCAMGGYELLTSAGLTFSVHKP